MRNPRVDVIDVVRACVALQQQRRRLSVRNVRLELDAGSYSTIDRHLRWLALRDPHGRSEQH
ncbi:DNA-binding protein [Ralstonia pickettii]|nr:DNA-binding protein [Ralstonia pickettii]MBX4003040.1 DNA-binding protein [Ralstonia pickettii]MBX4029601.1 DNA-binding protein [Ralstonia pickettii]MBX4071476.1 DNA-binding protein [Ralstonia pickettii]MBX4076596.1 DNA-binding protein [Ralstonia pickettii]